MRYEKLEVQKNIYILILLLQSTLFYSQNFPIIGNGDAINYTIGHYPVPGSDGLDLHWYGGIRFGDWTSNSVMQITNGNVGIGTTSPTAKLDIVGDIYIDNLDWSTDNALRIREGSSNTYGAFFKYGLNDLLTIGTRHNDLDYTAFQVPRGSTNVTFNGNVGIGTTNPTSKLTVAGNISSREVKVTVDAGADFVFEKDYDLPSLTSLDNYIKENKHLPEIASAKEMQKEGINLSEMNIKLLQKIEELTLYTIEQNKKLEKQNKEIDIYNRTLEIQNKDLKNQQKLIGTLTQRLNRLEKK